MKTQKLSLESKVSLLGTVSGISHHVCLAILGQVMSPVLETVRDRHRSHVFLHMRDQQTQVNYRPRKQKP